jgi:hypothetical protein
MLLAYRRMLPASPEQALEKVQPKQAEAAVENLP